MFIKKIIRKHSYLFKDNINQILIIKYNMKEINIAIK